MAITDRLPRVRRSGINSPTTNTNATPPSSNRAPGPAPSDRRKRVRGSGINSPTLKQGCDSTRRAPGGPGTLRSAHASLKCTHKDTRGTKGAIPQGNQAIHDILHEFLPRLKLGKVRKISTLRNSAKPAHKLVTRLRCCRGLTRHKTRYPVTTHTLKDVFLDTYPCPVRAYIV